MLRAILPQHLTNAYTHATPDGLKGQITLLVIVPFFCLSQKEKQFK